MAKLKYDRPICIYIRKGEILEVPKDEVWKVSSNADVAAPNKILGGGTPSETALGPHRSQASPSRPSTSKPLHGGGSPWLRNLSLIDRCQLKLPVTLLLLSRLMRCGKRQWGPAKMDQRLLEILTSAARAGTALSLEEAQVLISRVTASLRVSLSKSSINNSVEG